MGRKMKKDRIAGKGGMSETSREWQHDGYSLTVHVVSHLYVPMSSTFFFLTFMIKLEQQYQGD